MVGGGFSCSVYDAVVYAPQLFWGAQPAPNYAEAAWQF